MRHRLRSASLSLSFAALAALAMLATLALPSATSAIAARDYTSTFREHQQELIECAQGLQGAVVIRFHVGGRGRLSGGEVVTAEPATMRPVGQRILARARAWHFDQSTSGGQRQLRLTFTERGVQLRNERPTP